MRYNYFMIVITVDMVLVQIPINNQHGSNDNVDVVALKTFDNDDVSKAAKSVFPEVAEAIEKGDVLKRIDHKPKHTMFARLT